MTPTNQTLLIGCVAGVVFGIAACSGWHAQAMESPTATVPCPQGYDCVLTEHGGIRLTPFITAPIFHVHSSRTECEVTMETAMRVRDLRDRHVPAVTNITDLPNSWSPGQFYIAGYDVRATPDLRTAEEKLDDEQLALDRRKAFLVADRAAKQERAGRRIVSAALWDLAKSCWGSEPGR